MTPKSHFRDIYGRNCPYDLYVNGEVIQGCRSASSGVGERPRRGGRMTPVPLPRLANASARRRQGHTLGRDCVRPASSASPSTPSCTVFSGFGQVLLC
eukprot:gene10714-biopygen22834